MFPNLFTLVAVDSCEKEARGSDTEYGRSAYHGMYFSS